MMARRPLIGITTSVVTASTGATRIQLNLTYERAIREAGGLPVLLAPGLDDAALDQITVQLQGLLLPGGLDVDPARYRAERHPTTEINADLDHLEFPLAERALRSRLPVLAICRGIQLLNVACGGALWEDPPREHPPHRRGPRRAPRPGDSTNIPARRRGRAVARRARGRDEKTSDPRATRARSAARAPSRE